MSPDLISGNEEDPRIRKIVSELCAQLAFNRDQTRQLKKQFDELKNRVECNGPIFRRGPPFDAGTDLERQNAQLIYENQILNEENAELTAMVKEYERSLKTIMMRFRRQAYEIQQNKLEMQRNYEMLLEEQREATSQILLENASLQTHLSNLGNLVREAYEAQSDLETDILMESLIIENQGLREMLKIADGTGLPTSSTKNHVNQGKEDVIGQIPSTDINKKKISPLEKNEVKGKETGFEQVDENA